MRRLPSIVLVYTEAERANLARVQPKVRTVVAPNTLYPARALVAPEDDQIATDVIFVGRLTRSKKPELAIRAFALSCSTLD